MILQKKEKEVSSKDIAKDRLKNIITKEKTMITGDVIDMIKADMISVASDYVEVEKRACEVLVKKIKSKSGKENHVLVSMITLKQ